MRGGEGKEGEGKEGRGRRGRGKEGEGREVRGDVSGRYQIVKSVSVFIPRSCAS